MSESESEAEDIAPETLQRADLIASLQNIDERICLVDSSARITLTNCTVADSFYRAAPSRMLADCLPEPLAASLTAAIDSAFHEGKETVLQREMALGGHKLVLAIKVKPLRQVDESGLALITLRDITKYVSIERRQEILEKIDRSIFTAASIDQMLEAVLDEMLGFFDCDRAWLFCPCNPEARHWQVPMEKTRPKWPGASSLADKFPMNDAFADILRNALESKGPIRYEPEVNPIPTDSLLRSKFGVKSQLIQAIFPQSGDPWLLGIHHCEEARRYGDDCDVFHAIASRLTGGLSVHLARKESDENAARYRTIFEHSPDTVVIFDIDSNRFEDVNSNAEILFGLSREELLKTGLVDLSPPIQPNGEKSADLAARYIDAAMRGETPIFEWTHLNAKQEIIPCEVRIVRMPHRSKRLLRGSITNLSERKAAESKQAELETQLLQAQKMEGLGQLTGGLAHDFNNLLTAIIGNIELLRLDADDKDNVLSLSGHALDAARRGGELIQHLLAFARKKVLQPHPIRLDRLIKDLEPLLRRSLGETIEFSIVHGGDLWQCEIDPVQMENAILNLAINSRDAMPEGGKITIETSNAHIDHAYAESLPDLDPGQYVLFAITDNGTGIPEDMLDRVIEPFYTTKEIGKGSGLGLSMIYGFVKQSQGHMKIYSEVGIGTTVKIYLPRVLAQAEILRSDPPVDLCGHGEMILIVEDEASLRETARHLVESLGYGTLEAGCAREALEQIKSAEHIDLLFTDVVLPGGMNGVELARAAQKIKPNLHVLYTSGYTANAIVHHGRLESGIHLLEKPYSREELARRIRLALEAES